MKNRFTPVPLIVALSLAGCASTPGLPAAPVSVPQAYRQAATDLTPPTGWKWAEPSEGQARGEWWRGFQDETLDRLQAQAQASSPTLVAAAARVQAVRASLRGAEADRLPTVSANLGVTRQKFSPAEQGQAQGVAVEPLTVWRGGLGIGYELDLFQRVANSVSAAQADAVASEATYRSVLLALQADVAQTYFQLRTLDAEAAVLAQGLDLRAQTLALTQKRLAAGDVSELDVARSRTDVASTRAELQALKGLRVRTEQALALAVGAAPSTFSLPARPWDTRATVPSVPAGLPSTLLERRPDVVAAQAQVQAASARVGQARAALFPALMLTSQGGYASFELRDLFEWSTRSWLASAVLSTPLFDGGRSRSAVARSEAQLAESAAVYRQSVLQAFSDVETQLVDLGSLREQSASIDEALVAARRSTDLAGQRYRAGEDPFLSLLDAQRSQLVVERQAWQLRGAWARSTVALVRALGGGWESGGAQSPNP